MRPRRVKLVVTGIHDPATSDARVVVIDDQRIAWIGAEPGEAPAADATIALDGCWLTPGFVDAHVHATATGLRVLGLDLTECASARELCDRVRAYATASGDDPLLGSGWDDFGWPEGHPPTARELSVAAPGRVVLLERVEGHSCLVDATTLAAMADGLGDGVERDARGEPTGWLREQAAERARQQIHALLSRERVQRARVAAAEHALRLGITCLHEMGHPGLSSLEDARAWAEGEWPVEVLVWWAELDVDQCVRHGLRPGGDLFLDGAIGPWTAAVSSGFRDGPASGGLFHAGHEVAAFFTECSRRGLGAGVHAIGDLAIEQAISAVEQAAAEVGLQPVRACRHRIEHAELPTRAQVRRMARLGVVASVQPAFDAVWGGADGLYAARLGVRRALESNPLAWFAEAGCSLAFSSDSTVTPMGPWAGVLAAERHHGGLGVDRRAAIEAYSLGGRHVAHQNGVGPLRPGYRADLAIWDADPLTTADPRDLHCVGTVVRGLITVGTERSSLSRSIGR